MRFKRVNSSKLPRYRPFLIVVGLVILMAGCKASTSDLSNKFLGRWHRAGQPGVSDPLGTLASEYIEFYPNGILASLLFDREPGLYWTTMTGEYLISEPDTVTIQGKCWQGWKSFDCSGVYRFSLRGDTLSIFDVDSEQDKVMYQRVGDIGTELLPTIIPPMATSDPTDH